MVEALGPPSDFVPQKFVWVIIKNKIYLDLRTNDPDWNFKDIEYVDEDAENARRGFLSLGADPNDIILAEDLLHKDFCKLFQRI